MDAADSRVWLTSIAQPVHIRIAAGEQNAIKALDRVLNKVRPRNKRDMNGRPTCAFYGFAIVPRQIESLRFQFNAHRDPDARSVLLSHSKKSDARINVPR